MDNPYGVARVEDNGTSLQNFANADLINSLVKGLNDAGIAPYDIAIVSFYKAQTRLLLQRIERRDDGSLRFQEIETADSYQGREARVVIVDFVVADMLSTLETKALKESEEDPDSVTDARYTKVTAFVRDPYRINVALTRAKDGLILVGQAALFSDKVATTKGKLGNTLVYMVRDALNRGLVHRELRFRDTHPAAVAERQAMTAAAKKAAEEAESKYNSFAFISNIIQRNHEAIETKTKGPTAQDDNDQEVPKFADFKAGQGKQRGNNRGGRGGSKGARGSRGSRGPRGGHRGNRGGSGMDTSAG